MQALILRASGLRLENVPIPSPDPEKEGLVEVAFAGICRTDLYAAEGLHPVKRPLTLGHELSGILRMPGSGCPWPEGTPVGIRPWIPCYQCAGCRRGQSCMRPGMLGLEHDGAFAEFLKVPTACLVPLPHGISLEFGALLEPVAAALAPLKVGLTGKGAILGGSRIAILLDRVLRAKGLQLDILPEFELNPEDEGTYDYVIETKATEAALGYGLALLRPGGTLILKSRPWGPVPLDVTRAVLKDIRLQAVSYGSFEEAAALLASLSLDDLIAPPIPMRRYEEAFAAAREGTQKILMVPGSA